MTFDEKNTERDEAQYNRFKKQQRSIEDILQGRLIPEDPEIDIGV